MFDLHFANPRASLYSCNREFRNSYLVDVSVQQPIRTIVSNRKQLWRPQPQRIPQNLIAIKRANDRNAKLASLPGLYMHSMRWLNLQKFKVLEQIFECYDMLLLTETWLETKKERLYNLNKFTLQIGRAHV